MGFRTGGSSVRGPGRRVCCGQSPASLSHDDDFLYIDRIFVDRPARGAGLGRRFYRDLESFAEGRASMLACEVNERPPNPVSMRFHENCGFKPVGRQTTRDGAKVVVMMRKWLSRSSA